ncbi:GNAT family N-acetyltransferase [Streptomyces sp. NPDC051907]|uniref:GNAT family N-acetyltransferase n=1 Tax=Streptomyces sp. NPDC051907 TaxID=3155284 RepID=UPI003419C1DF
MSDDYLTVGLGNGVTLRPYTLADESDVLRLVDADRLPGQPEPNRHMLGEALHGRSPVDTDWWADLQGLATQVAVNAAGDVVGVVSYAVRAKGDTGDILWLHCREDEATADALIRHAVAELAPRRVEAFQFASALSLGLEALPVRHRPATARALEGAGFAGERLWRYMRADLPAHTLPRLSHVDMGPDPRGENARRLEARRGGRVVAEAVVGVPVQGTGVLWWIEVAPEARGHGIGRAVLGSALDVLAGLGAREVILYVDDDAPPGDDRDRTAANSLYDSSGFEEIDRLYSYRLSGPS